MLENKLPKLSQCRKRLGKQVKFEAQLIRQAGADALDSLQEAYDYEAAGHQNYIQNPDSLYYYRGANVLKHLGRLALQADYQLHVLSSEKSKLKPIIKENKAKRQPLKKPRL